MSKSLTLRVTTTRLCGILTAVLLASGVACSDQEDETLVGPNGAVESAPDTSAPPDDTGPVYALMTQVYDLEDRTVYVSLSDTLDIESVSLRGAREFPGVANLAAVGGRLLISDGQAPLITAYDIGGDLSWRESGSLSFAAYPLADNANFYYQFILDDHTAYLPYDTFKRIIWDPAALEIRGVMEDTNLVPEQGNLLLEGGGNRNSVHYDGPALQAFFYHDEDWFNYGAESLVAVYDPLTHAESNVIHLPCPGLSIATRDEAGFTYFGTWGFLGTLALYGEGPAPCIARLKPDLSVDEAWTTDLTSQTEGRYANNFRYIGNGKALANVLHHELLGADFTTGYDADVGATIDASGPHWRLWLFDIEQQTAAPVDGIDVDISSGAQFAVLDGRTFIFLPFEDYGRTMVYELDANAQATRRLEVEGDVFKWIRVR